MEKICFFNTVKFWGGGEKLHLENALYFRKKGYDVCIVTQEYSELKTKAVDNGFEVNPITVGNLSFLNVFKLIRQARWFRKAKVDTVVFSTSQDMKFASLSAKLAGVKRIVYLRGLAVPIKAKIINKVLLKNVVTHIIANSEATKNAILQHMKGYLSEDSVKVIYHGIEIDESELNASSMQNKDIEEKGHGVILGNAGRLTTQKGQKHLINIARILKDKNLDFTLFIAGQGELKEHLKQLIASNNLEKNVILLDFVSDMKSFMKSIDIFVLSSLWEGFGYVLVEAMIEQKPVVAWDISSNPEIMLNNKTGFLAKQNDESDFADKVEQLVLDKYLRDKMGVNGEKWVRDNFNINDRINELEKYLLN